MTKKDDLKYIGTGIWGRDRLAHLHPLNRDLVEFKVEERKYPVLGESHKPSLVFKIVKHCFHAVFIILGLLCIWEFIF